MRRPIVLVLSALAGLEVVALLGLMVAWQPQVRGMLRDFGGTLPLFTRLVLTRAWALGAVLLVAALTGTALGTAARPRVPVAVLIAAVTLGLAAGAAIVVGSYMPIFQLAGAVRAG